MDAIEMIMDEHRRAEQLFAQLQGNADEARMTELIELLTAHTEAEERALYPMVAELVEGGRQLVAEATGEHREAEQLMEELERMAATGADARPVLVRLEQAVRHHVEEEERELLPKLRERADADVLDTLARALVSVEAEASGDADALAEERSTAGA